MANNDVDDVGDQLDELNFLKISSDFKNFETLGSILDVSESDESDSYESDSSSLSDKFEDTKYSDKSFDLLWPTFSSIGNDDRIRKRVVKKGNGISTTTHSFVKLKLSGFWEGTTKPFEYDKSAVWDLENDFLMPGLLMAVQSMEVGEYSIFLISYKIMYGETGCPPRLRPKSTSLYHIHILGSMNENIKASTKDLTFEEIINKVDELCTQGDSFYKKDLFSRAEGCFKSALRLLEKCPLANEEESKKSTRHLLYIHLYLTMCYVKMKQPKKACCMCNDMKKIDVNAYSQNYRALFQNGLALMMIGEVHDAEKKFLSAIQLKPNDKNIEEQLKIIEEIKKKKKQQVEIVKKMSETTEKSKK